MNWVVLKGKVETEDKVLRFPSLASAQGSKYSLARCDKYFGSGTITFRFKFTDSTEGEFRIHLSNTNNLDQDNNLVAVSISPHSPSECFKISRIVKGNVAASDTNGGIDFFKPEKEYEGRIEAHGSVVELFVNDVSVAKLLASVNNAQLEVWGQSKGSIVIRDFEIKGQKPKAFVIMQFTDNFNTLYEQVIKPVCEKFGYECRRSDEGSNSVSILQDILQSIRDASVVVADITPNNPNVYYELGYAHGIQKDTILLSDKKRDALPFDISNYRTLFYDNSIAGKSAVEKKLQEHLQSIKH